MNTNQNITALRAGDTVKYSRPQTEYERGCRFILLSDPNVVRAVSIQLVCDLRIKPIEIVEMGEVELA